jgi:hypothetical protein
MGSAYLPAEYFLVDEPAGDYARLSPRCSAMYALSLSKAKYTSQIAATSSVRLRRRLASFSENLTIPHAGQKCAKQHFESSNKCPLCDTILETGGIFLHNVSPSASKLLALLGTDPSFSTFYHH